jgi:hypothetical protein
MAEKGDGGREAKIRERAQVATSIASTQANVHAPNSSLAWFLVPNGKFLSVALFLFILLLKE